MTTLAKRQRERRKREEKLEKLVRKRQRRNQPIQHDEAPALPSDTAADELNEAIKENTTHEHEG